METKLTVVAACRASRTPLVIVPVGPHRRIQHPARAKFREHRGPLTTQGESPRHLAIAREPRVSLVVDTETPPYAFVKVDRVVEISANLDEVRRVSTVAGGRYMGAEQAESFGERNSGPGECLVRLRPTSIVGADGVADWD